MAAREKKDPAIRRRLKGIAEMALERQGWRVERVPGSKKSSVRQITRGGESFRVTIRTSQDEWLAFPLGDAAGVRFGPLANSERVIVSTIDPDDSRSALVFDFPAEEVRDRFEKAYAARKAANHVVRDDGGGMWVSLFRKSGHPVYTVGGGLALDYKPIARASLDGSEIPEVVAVAESLSDAIAAAKRRIAAVAGVNAAQVRISIEA